MVQQENELRVPKVLGQIDPWCQPMILVGIDND